MNTWTAIVNPAANHGKCAKTAPEYLQRLRENGLSITEHYTTAPGDARRIACEVVTSGERFIMAVGGDGTVNEIVNGFVDAGLPEGLVLGTLPLGTGNSYLADFNLQDPQKAARQILEGEPAPSDLLKCTLQEDGSQVERWSLNNILAGFGADVGALMNRRLKPFGEWGYTIGVLIELARLNPPCMTLEIDGETHDRPLTMINVGNSEYTGGNMRISPGSIVDDGKFEVLLVEKITRLQLIRAFTRIYKGTHLSHPCVNMLHATKLSLTADKPLPLLFDGDVVGTTPLTVEIIPGAIRVIR